MHDITTNEGALIFAVILATGLGVTGGIDYLWTWFRSKIKRQRTDTPLIEFDRFLEGPTDPESVFYRSDRR